MPTVVVNGVELDTASHGECPELLGPLRRWRGLTWVGWANRLVLRWFFVRLAYRVNPDNTLGGYFWHTRVWPWPWSNWRRIGSPKLSGG